MYVRNTHTHTHTHAPGDWNIPLYIFFACFSLPTLGSRLLGYTISELQPIALCTRQVLSSTYTSSCYLSYLTSLTGSTLHLPHTKGNPELYPSKQYEKAKISHILV